MRMKKVQTIERFIICLDHTRDFCDSQPIPRKFRGVLSICSKSKMQYRTNRYMGWPFWRPCEYEAEKLLPWLRKIWRATDYACGRRLVAMLPEWIPAYEEYEKRLPGEVREQLLGASGRTLDRLLEPLRMEGGKRSLTRPGSKHRKLLRIVKPKVKPLLKLANFLALIFFFKNTFLLMSLSILFMVPMHQAQNFRLALNTVCLLLKQIISRLSMIYIWAIHKHHSGI